MPRSSRFEKLEGQRRATDTSSTPSTGAALERFEGGAEPVATPGLTDAPEASLERFAADGASVVTVDDDELSKLPTLVCARCHAEGGRYDVTCFNCGSSLRDREARVYNLKRLANLEATRREEAMRRKAALTADIADEAMRRAVEKEREQAPEPLSSAFFLFRRILPRTLAIVVAVASMFAPKGVGRALLMAAAILFLLSSPSGVKALMRFRRW